jgi:hypothetical protein
MSLLTTYSPEDVDVLIAGVLKVSGFVDGTFVSIKKDVPIFTARESADGVISRVYRPSKTFTLTLHLASTSASNEVLSVLSTADAITNQAIFPVLVKDHLGSTLLFAQSAWIESTPDVDFGTSISERVWVIRCSNASLMVGGNEEASGLLTDLAGIIAGVGT